MGLAGYDGGGGYDDGYGTDERLNQGMLAVRENGRSTCHRLSLCVSPPFAAFPCVFIAFHSLLLVLCTAFHRLCPVCVSLAFKCLNQCASTRRPVAGRGRRPVRR